MHDDVPGSEIQSRRPGCAVWRWLRRVLWFALIASFVWLLVVIALSVMIVEVGRANGAQASDAILVLGSGLRRDGRPGDALYRRSLWAADLYAQGIAPNVICTGGIGEGQSRSEADACAEVLRRSGVPAGAIVLEERSRSTEENAIYSREILTHNGWQTVTLVTDSFHMLRASWIMDSYDIDHYRSPVPASQVRRYFYVRHFSREIIALHWQAFKTIFNVPVTNVS